MLDPKQKNLAGILWTPERTAQELGMSVRTLATWRSTGRQELPFVKVGRLVRYRAQDVAAWLQGQRYATTTKFETEQERLERFVRNLADGELDAPQRAAIELMLELGWE